MFATNDKIVCFIGDCRTVTAHTNSFIAERDSNFMIHKNVPYVKRHGIYLICIFSFVRVPSVIECYITLH